MDCHLSWQKYKADPKHPKVLEQVLVEEHICLQEDLKHGANLASTVIKDVGNIFTHLFHCHCSNMP